MPENHDAHDVERYHDDDDEVDEWRAHVNATEREHDEEDSQERTPQLFRRRILHRQILLVEYVKHAEWIIVINKRYHQENDDEVDEWRAYVDDAERKNSSWGKFPPKGRNSSYQCWL